MFSFEESEERLRASARPRLGWNVDDEIQRGMVDVMSISQPHILVEGDWSS